MPDKMNDVAVDAELRGYTNEQASEAEQRAIEFLTKAVRIPGVRIDRDRYLREALDKVKATHDVIDRALASSPAAAGVLLGVLDFLADEAISYETNKSAALSFAAGIPGGFAMLGTIPADLTQYYVHALRIMQKLAYLYGWRGTPPAAGRGRGSGASRECAASAPDRAASAPGFSPENALSTWLSIALLRKNATPEGAA